MSEPIIKRRFISCPECKNVFGMESLSPEYSDLQAKHERVLEMLMVAEKLLKEARIDEKEKIYDNHGCPGFSGPMGVETKYDSILKQIEELKK